MVKVRSAQKNEERRNKHTNGASNLHCGQEGKYVALWVKRINCRNTVHKAKHVGPLLQSRHAACRIRVPGKLRQTLKRTLETRQGLQT